MKGSLLIATYLNSSLSKVLNFYDKFSSLLRCFCRLYVSVCPNQSQFCRQYKQIRKRAPYVFRNKKGCLLEK